MVVLCIWSFEGATMNIGYCSSYCKNIWNIGELVFLVFLLICMNECLSVKGATNWSKLLLIDLNVLAFQFPGAKEARSQTGMWPRMQYFFQINWSSWSVPFVWMYWMYLFLGLFQHFFVVCRSQCESKPSPNILLFLFPCSLLNYQILYKMCHFTYFSSVEACLPGNTVLNWLNCYVHPNVPKVSFSIKDV